MNGDTLVNNPFSFFKEILPTHKLTYLITLRDNIKPTLNTNILRHFTYHDQGHSDRMVVYLNDLISFNLNSKDEKRLSENEIFILLVAIYLHDISLQLPKAHGINLEIERFSKKEYDDIRENHGEISANIIMEIAKTGVDKYGIGMAPKQYQNFLPFISELCSKHQSKSKYDISSNVGFEGTIRIGMLIALLRIVDQMDCDHNRVDMTKLNQYSISPDSILHWIACYYIDSVSVKNGNIKVVSSFPDEMDPPEIDCICGKLVKKINEELPGTVVDYLWENNIRIRFDGQIQRQTRNYSIVKNVPDDDVRKLIRKEIGIKDPKDVESKKDEEPEKKDWISFWQMIGDPFRDEPQSYGSKNLVETKQFCEIVSEVESLINAQQGELKLVIGERGLGKTTLFQMIQGKLQERCNVEIVDVADIVQGANNHHDLYEFIFSRATLRMFGSRGEEFNKRDFIDNINRGKTRILCIDSLDRGTREKDPLIQEFFKISQHILTSSKGKNILIFSCSDRWKGFLNSTELSYLTFKNQWQLEGFSTDDAKDMLEKRLQTAGKRFEEVFAPTCITPLHAMSGGNPRFILGNAGNACRLAFRKKQTFIDVNFLLNEYKDDFRTAQVSLLEEQCSRSPLFKEGLKSLYSFYADIERRTLDKDIGSNYIEQMIGSTLLKENVVDKYFFPLKFVASIFQHMDQDDTIHSYLPYKEVKYLFSILKEKGYTAKDFLSFYSIETYLPSEDYTDLINNFKKYYQSSDDIKYYEQAKYEYSDVTKNNTIPHIFIRKSWDAVENLIVAVLIKMEKINSQSYETKREGIFYYDHLERKLHKRGAGKILSDISFELITLLKQGLRENGIYLLQFPSIQWIRSERNNIIRGTSGTYSKYNEKSILVCKNHLELCFKELLEVYEKIHSENKRKKCV